MLSRASSNAGERLRRAKSTSSTHTTSSGHLRTSTSIDPFVTRQQAEVAAVEAYQRARRIEEASGPPSAPPKLQRRRSQATGKTEGSHFEDARLGRRNSNRKTNAASSKPAKVGREKQDSVIEGSDGDEVVITRRRSVIPPNPSIKLNIHDGPHSLPASTRHSRNSRTVHSDGSPVPRNNLPATKAQSSPVQGRTPHETRRGGYSDSLAQLSDFYAAPVAPGRTVAALGTDHEWPLNGVDAVALARDKCLQDFHHGKLRERKSFLFAPFQKRRATNIDKSSTSYDTTLPPYNFADGGTPPLPAPPASISGPSIEGIPEKETHHLSTSLKGRFMKAFRRSSRTPSGLPAQHIEAKYRHYPAVPDLLVNDAANEDLNDPFTAETDNNSSTISHVMAGSTGSARSIDGQSLAKSRKTSWTTSTAAGTWSTRNPTDAGDVAAEQNQLKRSDSMSTLRKASSFFGRPIKGRLRRPSRADLQSSEESAALYSALQERLRPEEAVKDDRSISETPEPVAGSAIASLPSQQQSYADTSRKSRWATIPTVRSVTPDVGAYKIDVPSPVTEVLTPEPAGSRSKAQARVDERFEPTPPSRLRRRPAVKAPPPSREQIARRIERSQNRWQSPLEDMSPSASRSRRVAMTEDNPYVLGSLNRAIHQVTTGSDLPHHARIGELTCASRPNVISPSVYSCEGGDASPNEGAPVEQTGNTITITSREVRSYSLSPPKRAQRAQQTIQGSQDWRRWLSNELSSWGEAPTSNAFSLPEVGCKVQDSPDRKTKAVEPLPHVELPDSNTAHGQDVQDSHSPTSMDTTDQRPPMLDTMQRSSVGSGGPAGGAVLRLESCDYKPEDIESNAQACSPKHSRRDLQDPGATSRCNAQRSESPVDHIGTQRTSDGWASKCKASTRIDENAKPTSSVESHMERRDINGRRAHHPRSALELRANYKSHVSRKARPVEVRRKSVKGMDINILEDATIQNISAGPYAAQESAATTIIVTSKQGNTPPPGRHGLPALSSAEWLAAGMGRKRDTNCASSGASACGNVSVSRSSPSRSANGTVAAGGGSPGQRMVTNWLDGRRSNEHSPAFV